MSNKRKPYNIYTKEFKLEALRMMEQSDRPASEIVMKFGIRRNLLLLDRCSDCKKGY